MNAEVTNPASTYMLPPTVGSVSAFDPDRDNFQRQPDFLLRQPDFPLPSEPQYTTTSFRSFDNHEHIQRLFDWLKGSLSLP